MALIGFVFSLSPSTKISIIYCHYWYCANLALRQIGFVFSNRLAGEPPDLLFGHLLLRISGQWPAIGFELALFFRRLGLSKSP
ncbi:MAG: hypothetical protein WBC05_17680 [Sedimentisphaerales bacterium]